MVKQLTNFTKVKWGEGNYMDREERVTRFASPEGNTWACEAAKEIKFYVSLDFRCKCSADSCRFDIVMAIIMHLVFHWLHTRINSHCKGSYTWLNICKDDKTNDNSVCRYIVRKKTNCNSSSLLDINKSDCQTNNIALSPKFPLHRTRHPLSECFAAQ